MYTLLQAINAIMGREKSSNSRVASINSKEKFNSGIWQSPEGASFVHACDERGK